MKSFFWIKLSTDFFEDPKILRLQSYPESEFLLVFWIKLVLLSLRRNDGLLMIDDTIPYSVEDFASLFKKPENTVRMALSIFEKLNMIVLQPSPSGEIIGVSEFVGFTDVEGLEDTRRGNRERQATFRKRQKEALAAIRNEKSLEKNSGNNALLPHDSLVSNKEPDVNNGSVTPLDKNRREENKNRVEEKREEKDFAPSDFSKSEKSSKPESEFPSPEGLSSKVSTRILAPHQRIQMDRQTVRWKGILPEDIDRWKEAYPAVDVDQQLREMEVWASAHRSKWKSNWLRFIVHWLSKEQDRGGSSLKRSRTENREPPKSFDEINREKSIRAVLSTMSSEEQKEWLLKNPHWAKYLQKSTDTVINL